MKNGNGKVLSVPILDGHQYSIFSPRLSLSRYSAVAHNITSPAELIAVSRENLMMPVLNVMEKTFSSYVV